jgi:hypothetical protein
VIVDRLPAAAGRHGKLGVQQRRLLPKVCSDRLGRGADDGTAAQIRQRESRNAVPAIYRADEIEKGRVIGDLQFLTRRLQEAVGRETARERHDLADEIDATRAIKGGKNARRPDEVGDRQRGLIIVERLGAAAQAARKLGVYKPGVIRTDDGTGSEPQLPSDHGLPIQIRKSEIGRPIAPVHGAEQSKQGGVLYDLQGLPFRRRRTARREVAGEGADRAERNASRIYLRVLVVRRKDSRKRNELRQRERCLHVIEW